MKSPASFKIFLTSLCVTFIIMITVTILANSPAYKKYAVLFALPTILIFTLSAIGIYSAATKKYENPREKKLNRIGLFGNSVICLFFLSIIIGGTMLAMR
jgi:hypothetical protein